MNRKIITTLALLGLCVPQLTLGGEYKKKEKKRCTAEAQVCIHAMVQQFEERGWIGIEMDKGDGRQVITKVVPDSPAERAGLAAGDAIVAFNGIALAEGEKVIYAEMKKALIPGHRVTLSIDRDGAMRDVEVTLSEVPQQLLAQWIGQHVLDQHADAPEAPESEE
jgi:predicted metalloprotease with PDZ domain